MKTTTLLNILHMVIDGLFDSMPILLSFMIISFAGDERQVGVIISAAGAVNTVAGLSAVSLARKLGMFRTLSLAIAVCGLGFVANAFSQSIYLAGLCFVLGGSGFSIFHNVAFSFIAANTERRSMGKAMGDFTAVGDIGRIPLASLAGFIAAYSVAGVPGWRAVCLAYGAGALLFAAFMASSSHRKEVRSDQGPAEAGEPKKFLPSFHLLRSRRHVLPMIASVLDAFGSNQVFVFLPFLLFSKGIDPAVIGAFALAFTFGCFLGKAALGRLVDMVGTRKIFIVSELLMAALLVILLLGTQLYVIIGASLLLGIVTKGTVPVVQAIITEPSRKVHEYADLFAINTFSRGILNMIAPALFGVVASAFGIEWSFGIMAIAAACAILPVLVMGPVRPLDEPCPEPAAE